MIAQTEATAPDDRALIEVIEAERVGDELNLQGTAVAYEGTVLLDLLDEGGTVIQTAFVTASAAGPERGSWAAALTIAADVVAVAVHQEEMEEGSSSAASRTVVIAL